MILQKVLSAGAAGLCCSNWTCSQLQDILLQREEELFQLQEENQQLREFLKSSFVKNMKLKAQVHVPHQPKFWESHERSLRCPVVPLPSNNLPGAGRGGLTGELKRNLAGTDEGPSQDCPWTPPQQISKRVCRNITAEFSSESPPEAHLDGWVLRVLGLKGGGAGRPSPACSLSTRARTSSEMCLDSFFGPSSTDACRTSTHQHSLAKLPHNCSVSSSPCCDFTVPGPSEDSTGLTLPSCPAAAFQSPEEPGFRWPAAVCSGARWSPAEPAARRSSPRSPPAEEVLESPGCSSSLVTDKRQRCVCSPGRTWGPADPPADVVFSMCLSPSSSIRTHSFPQGQAFIRNNPDGRWSFTWVPTHGP